MGDLKKGETKKKNPYRAIGVKHGKNPVTTAPKLADAMNELAADGYAVELMTVDGGFLVMGKIIDTEPQEALRTAIGDLLTRAKQARDGVDAGAADPDPIPAPVRLLMNDLSRKANTTSYTELIKTFSKTVPEVLREAPLQMVREVLAACEKYVTAHDLTHDENCKEPCPLSDCLHALVTEIRGFVKLQVQ